MVLNHANEPRIPDTRTVSIKDDKYLVLSSLIFSCIGR